MSECNSLIFARPGYEGSASRINQPAPGAASQCADTFKLASDPTLHPVYRGFLHKQKLAEPQAIQEVAVGWVTPDTKKANEFMAILVSRVTPRVRKWAAILRAAVENDRALGVNDQYERITGDALLPAELEALGALKCAAFEQYIGSRAHEGKIALLDRRLMAVLLFPGKTVPVGYCVFNLQWAVCALSGANDLVLSVSIEEVWIAPLCRNMKLSDLLKAAISHAVERSVGQVQCTAKWGSRRVAKYRLIFKAHAPRAAGIRFVGGCKDFILESHRQDEEAGMKRKLRPLTPTASVWGHSHERVAPSVAA